MIMVTDEGDTHEEDGSIDMHVSLRSPQTLGGTSSLLEIFVEDVDAAYKRAVDAGAQPTLPVSDCFWGDRYGWITDPYGHIWALATVIEELTPEQVHERMMAMLAEIQRQQ